MSTIFVQELDERDGEEFISLPLPKDSIPYDGMGFRLSRV